MILCGVESGLNYRRFVEGGKNIFAILICKVTYTKNRYALIGECYSSFLIKTPRKNTRPAAAEITRT
jgi:hypothetical protein